MKRIFKKIRLFRNKKKGSYFLFYNLLGFFPGNIYLYEEALRHKSSREIQQNKTISNERLEFLGDAILDAVVADLLFHRFKNKNEGFLTNTRSKIVQRKTLNQIALELGLNELLVSSSRINTERTHILGNALEALIGAIYLDKGFQVTYQFVEKQIIDRYLNVENIARKEVNFKSKLIEWSQKYKVDLAFELIENFTDENNNPVFQSEVRLNGLPGGVGIGNSKKVSQQNASQMALKKIKNEPDFLELLVKKNIPESSLLPAVIYDNILFRFPDELV